MGERGDDAAGEHGAEGGGEGGKHVPCDEEAHEQHQHALAGNASAEHGHEGRAEDDAEGVAGDQEAGGRDRDPVRAGDLREQAHDHEFGGADPEGPYGEGEECERHGGGVLQGGGGAGARGDGVIAIEGDGERSRAIRGD